MNKYKLFIRKYNILKNDYEVLEKVVETNDIYHEIGYIYCTTLEEIKRIDYIELGVNIKMDIRDSIEEKYTNYLNCETDDIDLTVEEAKFILVNDKKVHFVDDLLERAWGIILSELEKKEAIINEMAEYMEQENEQLKSELGYTGNHIPRID